MPIESIKKLPKAAQNLFESTFEKVKGQGKTDAQAGKIAWAIVKKRFKKKGDSWVARSEDFLETQYFSFEASPAEEFVERSEAGHIIHNYILSDMMPDSFGTKPTEAMLNKWASWLNEHKPEVDTDHEMFRQMKKQYGGNAQLVERAMIFKKGIAKTVKAFVDKGKLIVSLMFDKRYERYVEKVRGLSVEGSVKKDEKGSWVDGKLFGFSAMINERPSNARSRKV